MKRTDDNTSICMKNGILVYPVGLKGNNWKIEYSKNGKVIKTFDKVLTNNKQIQDAMKKTYKFLAEQLCQ